MEKHSRDESDDEYSSLELPASYEQVQLARRPSDKAVPQPLPSGRRDQLVEEDVARTLARGLPRTQLEQRKGESEEGRGRKRRRESKKRRRKPTKKRIKDPESEAEVARGGEIVEESKGEVDSRAGSQVEEPGGRNSGGHPVKEVALVEEQGSGAKLKLSSRERSSKYRQKKKARQQKLEELLSFVVKKYFPTLPAGAVPTPRELQSVLDDHLSRKCRNAAEASEKALLQKETELRNTEKLLSALQSSVLALQQQISARSRQQSHEESTIVEKLNAIIEAKHSSKRDCTSRLGSVGDQKEAAGTATTESGERILLERLLAQGETKKKAEVKGLGAGTYGEIFRVDGTVQRAVKLFKTARYFYRTMESEILIGKYAPGIPNVMAYEPLYTEEPIGVVMECMNMDLEKLLSLMHYHRWVQLFERCVPQTWATACRSLRESMDLLSLPSKRMIHELVTSACLRGGEWKEEERVPLCEMEVLNLFIQLANGLKHLHDARFIHGDLKSKNILVRMPAEEPAMADISKRGYECPRAELLLADLGGAKRWEEGTCGWRHGDRSLPICTYPNMAPEMWGVWYNQRGMVTSISDVWSLGCVFLEIWLMLFGEPESHPDGHFSMPWLHDAYENRATNSATGTWKLRCWRQAFEAWRAPESRVEGMGVQSSTRRQTIDAWKKVGDSLARAHNLPEGKRSLRRNLLFYILNCVLQPEQQKRQTAAEVLRTLQSWEKELQDIISDELNTARTIGIPFLRVCQKHGRKKKILKERDLPYEVLVPPREQDVSGRASLRSVQVGAPYRRPYERPAEIRDAAQALALRRREGQKKYDNMLFKPQ